jgi:hypothetical protein
MDDLLFSVPWYTMDKKGEKTWHQANYWVYSDGSFTCDGYSTGDHENVLEQDVPRRHQFNVSWEEYYTYVKQTGSDPLNDIFVKRTILKKQHWTFRLANSILGMLFVSATHGKKAYNKPDQLPFHIQKFLGLVDGTIKMTSSAQELKDFYGEECKIRNGWIVIKTVVDYHSPRSEKAIARELKFKAVQTLKGFRND